MTLWIILCFSLTPYAVSQTLPEESDSNANRIYKMKAVFLFNFIKYITWPDSNQIDTFSIAVLGKSKITPYLDQIASKKKVKGKHISIQCYNHTDTLLPSHILFIDSLTSVNIVALRKKYIIHNQLVVGDSQGLSQQGADISFYIEGNRVKFELNRKNIQHADLFVSSHLLKLAKIVD